MHGTTTAFCNSVPQSTAFAPVNWPPEDEQTTETANDAFSAKSAFINECRNRAARKRNLFKRRRRMDKLAKASRRRNRR